MSRPKFVVSLSAVDAYLDRCSAHDSQPHVAELAGELGISRVTLNRKFREMHGMCLSEYFAEKRHEKAARLLAEGVMAAEQIARSAGYGTPRTMQRAFGSRAGETPAQFRKSRKLSQK